MSICVEASYADHRYMKVYIHLTVLLLVGCLVEGRPKTLENCGKRDAPMNKIVGGEEAMPGEYPWMVSLQFKDSGRFKHICGASIINERYILTAAHCVENPRRTKNYVVIVGLHRMSEKSEPPARTYTISKIIRHKDFDVGDEIINDIALLRTEEPIQFEETGGYVNGICLPTSDADPEGWAIVTGWGFIKDGGPSSDTLRAVTVPLVPRDSCAKSYEEAGFMITDSQICAGTKNKDACQLDSGGPLIQRNEEGAFTQIGIVSYGIDCGSEAYHGVYTKVASFVDWMDKYMVE